MAVLVDSYSEANQSETLGLNSSNRDGLGQSFTGDGRNITSAKFYLRKVGSPSGNLVAKLYAHSGTYGTDSKGTGAALATSNVVAATSLSTSYGLIEFTFSTPYFLVNGTKYVIHVEKDGESPITAWNSSNYVQAGADNTSPSHAGNWTEYFNGSWVSTASRDSVFYVYGESTGTNVTVSSSVTSIIASIGAIAIITSQILSPSVLTLNSSIPSPSVQSGNAAYQPIGLLLALTKQANALTVTPSPVSASFEVQSPSFVTDQILSIGAKSLTFSIPAPTATSPSGFLVDTFEATFSTNPATVTTDQILSPSVKTLTFSLPTAAVLNNETVPVSVKSLTFSIPEVTLYVETNALVQPVAVSSSFSIPTPSFVTNNTLSIGVKTVTFSRPASGVVIRVSVSPAVKTVTLTTNATSLVTANHLDIPVHSLTFSTLPRTRQGPLWEPVPKPTTTWTASSKPTTTWTPDSKPSTIWTPLTKPPT